MKWYNSELDHKFVQYFSSVHVYDETNISHKINTLGILSAINNRKHLL